VKSLISTQELRQLRSRQAGTQLVDVRTASEYATGHVPGAMNVPLEQIEGRLDDIQKDSPVVLICQGGARAHMAAAFLKSSRDVTVLDGGTDAWERFGFPMVRNLTTRHGLEQQVRLAAGSMVLIGAVLALTVNTHWAYLSAAIGLGLTLAGLTGICPMGSLLCQMPWNRPRTNSISAIGPEGQCCASRNVVSAKGGSETIAE